MRYCSLTSENSAKPRRPSDQSIPASRIPLLSAVGGSIVTRTASRHTFQKTGRSMVTQDMLVELGQAFAYIFGQNE